MLSSILKEKRGNHHHHHHEQHQEHQQHQLSLSNLCIDDIQRELLNITSTADNNNEIVVDDNNSHGIINSNNNDDGSNHIDNNNVDVKISDVSVNGDYNDNMLNGDDGVLNRTLLTNIDDIDERSNDKRD